MSADQWDAAFAGSEGRRGAVTVMEGPIYGLQAPQMAAARAEARAATVFPTRPQVEAGA